MELPNGAIGSTTDFESVNPSSSLGWAANTLQGICKVRQKGGEAMGLGL